MRERGVDLRGIAANAELDPTPAVRHERRQAEQPEIREPRDVLVHHRQQLALAGAIDDDRALGRGWRGERRIARREHPVEHWPRHLREAREEVVVADREGRDAVDGVRDDRAAFGKIGHQHAMGPRVGAKARLDLGLRLRMPDEGHAERGGRRLSRVVVGRRADTTEREDDFAAAERFAQRRGEPYAVVAFVARPCEHEPARAERLDHVGEVPVRALAGQDLVADDQRADRIQSAATSVFGN
jgi:hypothetical protein